MRKSISLVLAVVLFGVVVVLAQTHSNTTEKKASAEVTFTSDVMVGTHLLKAGRYQIACDTKTVKFSLITTDVGMGQFTSMKKVLEVPCEGNALTERHVHTEMSMPANKAGVPVLQKLLLDGSNVEHVFPGQQ